MLAAVTSRQRPANRLGCPSHDQLDSAKEALGVERDKRRKSSTKPPVANSGASRVLMMRFLMREKISTEATGDLQIPEGG